MFHVLANREGRNGYEKSEGLVVWEDNRGPFWNSLILSIWISKIKP